MLKRGLDQVSSWILAIGVAGVIFGGLYFVTKRVAATQDLEDEGIVSEDGASEAGAAEAGMSGESAAEHEDSAKQEHSGTRSEDSEEHQGDKAAPAAGAKAHEGAEEPASSGENEEHGEVKPEGRSAAEAAASDSLSQPEWGYRGSFAPENWGGLAEAYKTCEHGKEQSPVDIESATVSTKLLPLRTHYKSADVTFANDGHTLVLRFEHGNYVEIDGERFDLQKIAFHSPSEHKIKGVPYDMEVHLIHKNAAGKPAVLAVLFEEGKVHATLEKLWSHAPRRKNSSVALEFDPQSLLPKHLSYYHYTGSLTTPPCKEGVAWYVLADPVELSAKQVDTFVSMVNFNARPVQELAGRRVLKSGR